MQAKFALPVFFTIAMALLAAGCTGAGQPDAGATAGAVNNAEGSGVANVSSAAAAPDGLYASEFASGYGHHAKASSLFDNATSIWDEGNYAGAYSALQDAREEYIQAECNYNNMASYAGSDPERAFASALEESAIGMDEATSRYLMSIDASVAGNDAESLEYFREGQELVDGSQAALNQSLSLMPPYLALP